MLNLNVINLILLNIADLVNNCKYFDKNKKKRIIETFSKWKKVLNQLSLTDKEIFDEKLSLDIYKEFIKSYQSTFSRTTTCLYFHHLYYHIVNLQVKYGNLERYSTNIFESNHKIRNLYSERKCFNTFNPHKELITNNIRTLYIKKLKIGKYLEFEKKLMEEKNLVFNNYVMNDLEIGENKYLNYFLKYENDEIHGKLNELTVDLMKKPKNSYDGELIEHLTKNPFEQILVNSNHFEKIFKFKVENNLIIKKSN